ncbi:hypothetical protein FZC66_04495 [Priestia megaterium]|nr:hypothetical protein FZC66_04495 [Priestia megaterium]
MKKIVSIIVIAFLLSFCNLPNYVHNNSAYAAEYNYEFTGDLEKDIQTLKDLIKKYKELGSSSSITVKVQKAAILSKITLKISEIKNKVENISQFVSEEAELVIGLYESGKEILLLYVQMVHIIGEGVKEFDIELSSTFTEDMEQLNKDLAQINKDLDGIDMTMADIDKSMAEVDKSMKELDGAFDGMTEGLDEAIKDIQEGTKLMARGLDQMNAGIATANEGMNQMVSSVNKANEAINGANKSINSVVKSVDKVNSHFSSLDKTLSEIDSNVYPKNVNINEKMNDISKGLTAIDNIQTKQIAEFKGVEHVDSLNKDLKTVQTAGSFVADLLPIISQIKGANDSISGKDLITREDLKSLDRTISGLSVLGGGMVKIVGSTSKTLGTAGKVGTKVNDKYGQSIAWSMPKGGGVINGRKYTEHALERMAPNTAEVRAELTTRAHKKASEKGLAVGTKEYNTFIKSYVDPRGITPTVIEDVIKSTPAKAGSRAGTFDHIGESVKVVVNSNGDVITVIPR